MDHLAFLPVFACLLALTCLSFTHATQIDVVNNCGYPVWAAASAPNGFGGGQALPNRGDTWTLTPPPGTAQARIWPRTGCTFDSSGNGHCNTGDCGGVLQCKGYGTDPQTLAEFTLKQPSNTNPDDTFDISLVEGFNVPLSFSPVNPSGGTCRPVQCTADIVGQCPDQLKALGGCNNPCTVFQTVQYCCTSVRGSCGPTPYSQFFKQSCPDAYSYPQDDQTSTFACPSGTNYRVTFCP